jgi:hypothetical protein
MKNPAHPGALPYRHRDRFLRMHAPTKAGSTLNQAVIHMTA